MATITLSHQALNAFNSSVDPIIKLLGGKTEGGKLEVIEDNGTTVTVSIPDEELIRVYSAIGRVVTATVAAIQQELA